MSIQHPLRTLAIALVFILALVAARHVLESTPAPDPLNSRPLRPSLRIARETSPRVDEPPTIVEPNDNWMETPDPHSDELLPDAEGAGTPYLPPPQMSPDGRLRR